MSSETQPIDWRSASSLGILTLFDFGSTEVAIFTTYQILAFSAFSITFISVNLLIFKEHSNFGHPTAKILAVSYKIAQLFQSCFAIAVTALLLIFRHSIFTPWISNLFGMINIVAIEQSFISLLIVIDIGIRVSKKSKYGSNTFSIVFIIVALILTILFSYLLWFLMTSALATIMVFCFISIIALMQMSNAVLTIYLIKTVKEMRRKSVLTSSLTERHECFKNLELLKYFLPISGIAFICGILSLFGTLAYIFSPTPFYPFCCVFGVSLFVHLPDRVLAFIYWYELSAILTSIYYIWIWLKTRYFSKQNTIQIISKHTFQTLDSHFDALKQVWRT